MTDSMQASSPFSSPLMQQRRRSARLATPQLSKSDDYIDTSTPMNIDVETGSANSVIRNTQPVPVSLPIKQEQQQEQERKSMPNKRKQVLVKSEKKKVKKKKLKKIKVKRKVKKKVSPLLPLSASASIPEKTIPTKAKKKKSRTTSSPSSSSSSSTTKQKNIIYSSDVAKISPENPWIDLEVSPAELRPSATLTTGQCFNFVVVFDDNRNNDEDNDNGKDSQNSQNSNTNSNIKQKQSAWGTHDETEWIGPIQNFVLSIKETETTTLYRVLQHGQGQEQKHETKKENENNISEFLKNYFQLETPLEPLYKKWSKNDIRLGKIAPCIPGVRIIRQDPIECMFSFICSSNNNIPRITKMLSSFRKMYGQKLIDIPTRRSLGEGKIKIETGTTTETDSILSIYSFPTLQELKCATEEELRQMGLGYRAKYIIQTRDLLITNGGKEYLLSLRKNNDSEKVQEELLQYVGIGRKVADCVALFSLDQKDAIPVDVHVQHIASRDYDPSVLGTAKSLTPRIYKQVGNLFRDRFAYAGWAHSLLFVAELPSFRDRLPEDVVIEMDEWREAEMAKKALEKEEKKKKSSKTKP